MKTSSLTKKKVAKCPFKSIVTEHLIPDTDCHATANLIRRRVQRLLEDTPFLHNGPANAVRLFGFQSYRYLMRLRTRGIQSTETHC
jgi:hypothetical protein